MAVNQRKSSNGLCYHITVYKNVNKFSVSVQNNNDVRQESLSEIVLIYQYITFKSVTLPQGEKLEPIIVTKKSSIN